MIYGLTGPKGSGKDTVAAYLVKKHRYERRAFADPLKRSVAALLDIPFAEVDKLKNNDEVLVGVGKIGEPEYDQWIEYIGFRGLTFRKFLQRYGTESHRDVFGQDFWLDVTLPLSGYYSGRNIVVSDCRFENEAARIRYLRGKIVDISRFEAVALSKQDPHPSEKPLEADIVIFNNGSIEDLYESVEETLNL